MTTDCFILFSYSVILNMENILITVLKKYLNIKKSCFFWKCLEMKAKEKSINKFMLVNAK